MPGFIALAPVTFAVLAGAKQRPDRPNILFLLADDMRPQLASYGQDFMITPHLDALAASALQFDFAYTNFAFCAPSRASFMSGRRPDTIDVQNFVTRWNGRPWAQDWIPMPQFFRDHGYFTSAAGKVYHDTHDHDPSWSYPSHQTPWVYACVEGDIQDEYGNYCGITENSVMGNDEDWVLEACYERLEAAVASGQPWFVGCGFHRPHWAFRTPRGFYGPELYPPGPDDVVQLPAHPGAVENGAWMAGNSMQGTPFTEELCCDWKDPAHGCPTCITPADRAREYRRWYYAAVTMVDHYLGQVLQWLHDSGLSDETIVLFTSDHGFQLGEDNEWSKKGTSELQNRIPFIARVPWMTQSVGQHTSAKAELVDLYRTFADLAGLEHAVADSVQGTSLAPVFEDVHALGSKAAYSQIPSCGCFADSNLEPSGYGAGSICHHSRCSGTSTDSSDFDFLGYSVRTGEWRFTVWVPWDHEALTADWSRLEAEGAEELFDLRGFYSDFDFPGLSVNVAGLPEHAELVEAFRSELQETAASWTQQRHPQSLLQSSGELQAMGFQGAPAGEETSDDVSLQQVYAYARDHSEQDASKWMRQVGRRAHAHHRVFKSVGPSDETALEAADDDVVFGIPLLDAQGKQ